MLFWSLDRFNREGALPALQHLNTLESYGVGLKSFTEKYFNSTGLFKDAMISIFVSISKQECVRLSERTRAGLERAESKGKKLVKPAKRQEDIEQIRRFKGTACRTTLSEKAWASRLVQWPSTWPKFESILPL